MAHNQDLLPIQIARQYNPHRRLPAAEKREYLREEQRRTRTPLPAKHRAPAQRARRERLVIHLERLRRACPIGIDEHLVTIPGHSPHFRISVEGERARATQLLQLAERAAAVFVADDG